MLSGARHARQAKKPATSSTGSSAAPAQRQRDGARAGCAASDADSASLRGQRRGGASALAHQAAEIDHHVAHRLEAVRRILLEGLLDHHAQRKRHIAAATARPARE